MPETDPHRLILSLVSWASWDCVSIIYIAVKAVATFYFFLVIRVFIEMIFMTQESVSSLVNLRLSVYRLLVQFSSIDVF